MQNGVLKEVPGYATVQGIFIGVVSAFVILITIVGPEYVYPLVRFSTVVVDRHSLRRQRYLGIMLPTLNSTRRRSKKAVDAMTQLWRVTMRTAEIRSRRWTTGARRRDEAWLVDHMLRWHYPM